MGMVWCNQGFIIKGLKVILYKQLCCLKYFSLFSFGDFSLTEKQKLGIKTGLNIYLFYIIQMLIIIYVLKCSNLKVFSLISYMYGFTKVKKSLFFRILLN